MSLRFSHSFEALGPWLFRHRSAVLLISLVITVCLGWFGLRDGIQISDKPLFDPDAAWVKRGNAWAEAGSTKDEVVVLIDSGAVEQGEAFGSQYEKACLAAEALSASLNEEARVSSAVWGFDPSRVSSKLLLTRSVTEVAEATEQMLQAKAFLESESPAALMRREVTQGIKTAISTKTANGIASVLPATMRSEPPIAAASLDRESLKDGAKVFIAMLDAFADRLEKGEAADSHLLQELRKAAGAEPWVAMTAGNGRYVVVRVKLNPTDIDESLEAVESYVESFSQRFDDLELGITGYAIVVKQTNAEMRRVVIRALAGAAIGLMLLCGFAWRSVLLPWVMAGIVGLSLGWTVALTQWLLGGLQAFSIIAIGMVIVTAAWSSLTMVGSFARTGAAGLSLIRIGPGVFAAVLSSIGLALPMVVWGQSALRAAGLVLIIGGICLLVVCLMIGPVILLWLERDDVSPAVEERQAQMRRRGAGGMWLVGLGGHKPKMMLGLVAFVVTVSAVGSLLVPVTYDLTSFLPGSQPSVQWLWRLQQAGGGEVRPSVVSVCENMDELERRVNAFRAMPEVGSLGAAAILVPEQLEAKRLLLMALDEKLGASARQARDAKPIENNAQDFIETLEALTKMLGLAASTATAEDKLIYESMRLSAQGVLDSASVLDEARLDSRLQLIQQDYENTRQWMGESISELLEPGLINASRLAEVPEVFGDWQIELDGVSGWMIEINPRSDSEDKFVNALRKIDPAITGNLTLLVDFKRAVNKLMRWCMIPAVLLLGGFVGVTAGSYRVAFLGVGAVCLMIMSHGAILWFMETPIMIGAYAGLMMMVPLVVCLAIGIGGCQHPGRSAVLESFGLVLACGFIIAAAVRSSGSSALSSAVVALILSALVSGLCVLACAEAYGRSDK